MKLHFIIVIFAIICSVFAEEFENPLNLPTDFAEEYKLGKEIYFGGSKSCNNYESTSLYYSEMYSVPNSKSKKFNLNGYNVLFYCDLGYYPVFSTSSSYRLRMQRITMGYQFKINAALVYSCTKEKSNAITVTCKKS